MSEDERVVFDVGDSSFVIARGDRSVLIVQLGGCDPSISTIAGP
jgi:hypothetical protein